MTEIGAGSTPSASPFAGKQIDLLIYFSTAHLFGYLASRGLGGHASRQAEVRRCASFWVFY